MKLEKGGRVIEALNEIQASALINAGYNPVTLQTGRRGGEKNRSANDASSGDSPLLPNRKI